MILTLKISWDDFRSSYPNFLIHFSKIYFLINYLAMHAATLSNILLNTKSVLERIKK